MIEYKDSIFPFLWVRNERKKQLEKEIDAIKNLSINSFVVESRPYTSKDSDFATESWFNRFETILKYAKENHGAVLTIDYNLIKVAEAEKIPTLNINELALAVKTEFTPGDRAEVKITEKGSNPGQGVGHLASGVMVVVDNAASRVGETLPVRFVRLHETESGRIIFAKVARRKKRE